MMSAIDTALVGNHQDRQIENMSRLLGLEMSLLALQKVVPDAMGALVNSFSFME